MSACAVIVAAGYGTRLLPVTRVVPKELLPIVGSPGLTADDPRAGTARPALDLVLDELVAAGIRDVLLISSRRKRAVEDWFDRDVELDAAVADHATKRALAAPPELRLTVVRQPRMDGTGGALLLAREFAAGRPCVVAFPDDLFGGPSPARALLDAHAATGAAVLGAMDLPGQDVSAYGVLDVDAHGDVVPVRGIVEKPPRGAAPSHTISVGRYLYTPALFDRLAALRPRNADGGWLPGEYTPMPAMNALATEGALVAARLQGPRWDTGSVLGYLEAMLDHALADPRLGPDVARLLQSRRTGAPEADA